MISIMSSSKPTVDSARASSYHGPSTFVRHSQESAMTITTELPELALRSHDAAWNYTRWKRLPDDGNRYEVIDGVLYMTTAPSNFHQWIVRRLDRFVGIPL